MPSIRIARLLASCAALLSGALVALPVQAASPAPMRVAQGYDNYDDRGYEDRGRADDGTRRDERPRDDGYGREDGYRAQDAPRRDDSYRPEATRSDDAYRPRDGYSDPGEAYSPRGGTEYGEPYAPPRDAPYREGDGGPPRRSTFEQNEIVAAGHGFFGAVSKGLAGAVEYAFKSQGRPNGYILGEDAGGALVVGLRYGEGVLYTKDAGDHKVFWQGPSLGYDAGAEGSKAMVLVYNLRDPGDIYQRFGGAEGTAYLVGGVSVQFQTYGGVTLAVIRSGVGLRLGANLGYLKYTRAPTWNPL